MRWCWHRWSKWELRDYLLKRKVDGEDWTETTVTRQQSRCEKCGKVRLAPIGDPDG